MNKRVRCLIQRPPHARRHRRGPSHPTSPSRQIRNSHSVSPKWAPTVRESLEPSAGSSTPAVYVSATNGPTPGIVISRLHAVLALARVATSFIQPGNLAIEVFDNSNERPQ